MEPLDQYTLDALNALATIAEVLVESNGESWARNPTGRASFKCDTPHEGGMCGTCPKCEALLQISRAAQFIRGMDLTQKRRKK